MQVLHAVLYGEAYRKSAEKMQPLLLRDGLTRIDLIVRMLSASVNSAKGTRPVKIAFPYAPLECADVLPRSQMRSKSST